MTLWAALARIRDISRLVLAAIERDDVEEIDRLSREGRSLTKVIGTAVAEMKSRGTLPEDVTRQLDEVESSYSQIIKGLAHQRDAVLAEIREVRRSRSRLKAVGLGNSDIPRHVDRTT